LGTKHQNHNISPGRFWLEKSFVLIAAFSLLLRRNAKGVRWRVVDGEEPWWEGGRKRKIRVFTDSSFN